MRISKGHPFKGVRLYWMLEQFNEQPAANHPQAWVAWIFCGNIIPCIIEEINQHQVYSMHAGLLRLDKQGYETSKGWIYKNEETVRKYERLLLLLSKLYLTNQKDFFNN